MKKIKIVLVLFILLITISGCSGNMSKEDAYNAYLSAMQKTATIKNLYAKMEANLATPIAYDQKVSILGDFWIKTNQDPNLAELRLDFFGVIPNAPTSEIHLYIKDGIAFMDDGYRKTIGGSLFGMDPESLGTMATDTVFSDSLLTYFNCKGKKVGNEIKVTFTIKKELLKLLNDEAERTMPGAKVVKLEIVALIGEDGYIKTYDMILRFTMMNSGVPLSIDVSLIISLEELADTFEIEFPDFSEYQYIEGVLPEE